MTSTRGLRGAVVLAVAGALVGVWPGVAAARSEVAFSIKDNRITESSGLTRDTAGNRFWTLNDEGSTVYALSGSGEVVGSFTFRAQTVDPEAIAMVGDRLYVADIGDNDEQRDQIAVYYFDSPSAAGAAVTYKSWDFRYADGPHNAETLLVNSDGRLFVVTKGSKGAVYAAPRNPVSAGVNVLTKVGSAPKQVTDGVFLDGDQQIALLTKKSVQVVDAQSYDKIASAPMTEQPQPESITLDLDGKNLLVGSEGENSKVLSVPVPAAQEETPAPSPEPSASPTTPSTPTASETPADSEDVDPPADEESDTGSDRTGTYLALGLAAVVAAVAGAVVGLARRS
jgi:sugar lactone lactonase YvrE